MGFPGSGRDNDINLGMDEGSDEGGEAVGPAVPKGVLDGKVLPLQVAQLTHRIEKGLPLDGAGRIGPNRQESNRVHLPRRLRLGGEGRGEKGHVLGVNYM